MNSDRSNRGRRLVVPFPVVPFPTVPFPTVPFPAGPFPAGPFRVGAAILVAAMTLPGILVVGGCQKSEPDAAEVVSPPGPTSASPMTQADYEPPGTIELPAGADVSSELPTGSDIADPGSASGGLEMPADADPGIAPSTGDQSSTSGAGEIRYATWEQIEQAAMTSGRVTVVDLWSLVCEPCLKEFPGLVRLHNEHGEKVHCIAVDVDFDGRKTRPPETYEERVTAFIQSVGAKFPTYISQTPSDDVYAANKLASIPAVLVYDADGKLVQVFEDAGETAGFTYEKDIFPLVQKLAG